MPRFSPWNSGVKGKTYRTIDRWISQYFGRGGTAVYIHMYVGPHQQATEMINRDGTTIPAYDSNVQNSPVTGGITSIQDVLFLEWIS